MAAGNRAARTGSFAPLPMRTLLLTCLVLACLGARAFHIELHGVVTEHFTGEPVRDVQVRIVKDGIERETVITRGNGRYEFILDRGYTYLVWFYKDGWVTKHVKIDATKIPPIPDVPFYDMDVQMTMFLWIDGVDFTIFEQPLGLAEYVHSVRKLTWDIDYTEALRPRVAEVMDTYERRVGSRTKVRKDKPTGQ